MNPEENNNKEEFVNEPKDNADDFNEYMNQQRKQFEEFQEKFTNNLIETYLELVPEGDLLSDPAKISIKMYEMGIYNIKNGNFKKAEMLLNEASKAFNVLGNWVGLVSSVGSLVICKIPELYYYEIRGWSKYVAAKIDKKRMTDKYYKKLFDLNDEWLEILLKKNNYKCLLTQKELKKGDKNGRTKSLQKGITSKKKVIR